MNTPEGFRGRLYSRKHTVGQLTVMLMKLPPEQRGEALLDVFTDPDRADRYGDQQIAGQLLVAVRPQCHRSLDDLLRSTARTWNVSVEELPFYLCDVFGRDAVAEAAVRLEGEYAADTAEAVALATVRWWLRGHAG